MLYSAETVDSGIVNKRCYVLTSRQVKLRKDFLILKEIRDEKK